MTRKRRNFSKNTLAEGFARCGGRCEGIREDGARCNVVLVPRRWHGDHIRADGLDGEPILSNLACLCIPCHDKKTNTKDKPAIAQAKRRDASHVGVPRAKSTIPSRRGYPQAPKDKLPIPARPPRERFFVKETT